MSTELALPKTGDAHDWTDQERALVEAAGLITTDNRTGRQELAPRATVEAYLAHCRRTGLDPIARQIYAICRKGRWNIQVSIDGARLVAERSGGYEGQTPAQWTADGREWVDVWLAKDAPAAARVGVYRAGFREAVYGVARFSEYNAGGPMWQKMPATMIAKCAEMLALRKAFPQDLSGLYSTEEMDQAGQPQQSAREAAPAPREEAPADAVIDAEVVEDDPTAAWIQAIRGAGTRDELMAIWKDASEKGAAKSPDIKAAFADRGKAIAIEAAGSEAA